MDFSTAAKNTRQVRHFSCQENSLGKLSTVGCMDKMILQVVRPGSALIGITKGEFETKLRPSGIQDLFFLHLTKHLLYFRS